MMRLSNKIVSRLRNFRRDDRGTTTIEFVVAFPIYFLVLFFTYETGLLSTRHVMLERGVDLAVREVRIGRLREPSADDLKSKICEFANILPNCVNQLELEMVIRDPRNWTDIPRVVKCIDRSAEVQPLVDFQLAGSNQMAILRACIRLDPVLPGAGIGKSIVENSSGEAGGSYALVATSAFVVEPFK